MYVLRKKNQFIFLSYNFVYSSIFLDSISLVRKKNTHKARKFNKQKKKQTNKQCSDKKADRTNPFFK